MTMADISFGTWPEIGQGPVRRLQPRRKLDAEGALRNSANDGPRVGVEYGARDTSTCRLAGQKHLLQRVGQISVAFAIDCHDREVPAFVASPRPLTGVDIRTLTDRTLWARFGEAALAAPHAIQWLSDNGPQYTATASVLYAHELGLVPITTPAYSPQSNGLAEAFVKTIKRDYVDGAELRDAETVLAQLSGWIEDYTARAPHSALGMRSPAEYRAEATLSSSR